MLILLSPTKTFTKLNVESRKQPLFTKKTQILLDKLSKYSVDDFKTKYKISENLANKTFNYFKDYNNNLSAVFTYGGTVFKHLDPRSISESELKRVHILSGLYGILRASDAISKYRLEMQFKGLGSLYDYWHIEVNNYLENASKGGYIIDLASNEYNKILNHDKLNVLTINFANKSGEKLTSPSMMVKKQRGLMANYILSKKIDTISKIKNININGYKYDESNSNDNYLLFVKGA